MKTAKFGSFQIHFHPIEEPQGVWWPNATLEAADGETAPVAVPLHFRSEADANLAAAREAVTRIRFGNWRN